MKVRASARSAALRIPLPVVMFVITFGIIATIATIAVWVIS